MIFLRNFFTIRTLFQLLLFVTVCITTLTCAEIATRILDPHAARIARGARELTHFRLGEHDLTQIFTVDPRFGFRPLLGNAYYNELGAQVNTYPREKSPARARVLFIGDSVTSRGKIIAALRKIYGDEAYEYWNAGVESFNTVQEVKFYESYNHAVHPDHVILSFHVNDFETTPVAFTDAQGKLVIYAPNRVNLRLRPWPYTHSSLYRLWIGFQLAKDVGADREKIVQATLEAIAELRGRLESDGIRFTVIVLPLFTPYEKWSTDEKSARARILAFLQAEGIRHFDLFPVMEEAGQAGSPIQQSPGDSAHPNDAIAGAFATFLQRAELLP